MPTHRPHGRASNTQGHIPYTHRHKQVLKGTEGHIHRPLHRTRAHTPRHTRTCTPRATLSAARAMTRCPRTHTEPLTNTQTGPHIQVAAAWLPHRHVVSSPSVSSGKEKRTGSVHPNLSEPQPHSHQPMCRERHRAPRVSRHSPHCPRLSADSQPSIL